ncbi:MAG TPA: branched-chain amino acid ABC transporter permease [Desulfotomaculum sp.]|nr:branched-chain amino acid ABC transporter permease [Desulfotomaculum sp.]
MMEKGRQEILFILLGGVILAFGGTFIKDAYLTRILVLTGINVILASSVNLLVGYTGQVCLAQAAFFGIGSYTSAILTVKLGISFWLALPGSFILAAFCGALLGMPTLRLKGHYLAIATMGFGIIVYVILNNWDTVTQGPMGILGINPPSVFGFQLNDGNYYLAFVILFDALVLSSIVSLLKSAYGRAFAAIKEDEISAEVSGVNTYYFKVLVFAISSGIAGLAGSLYAHYINYISPEGFDLTGSIEILILAIVGGLSTVPGPVIGSVGLMFLSEALRGTRELRLIIYGAMLVFVIVFLPEGVYPSLKRIFSRFHSSRKGISAESSYLSPSISRGLASIVRDLKERGKGV